MALDPDRVGGFFVSDTQDQASGTEQQDQASAAASTTTASATTGQSQEQKAETFDREYVEKLRKENADHRTRATKAEAELAKHKQAQETEAEKVQRERDEAAQRAATAEQALKLERVSNAVITAAAKRGVDPELAVRLMATEAVEYDADGRPTKVDAALDALIKKFPQLAATQSGGSSAANGARSANGGQPTETDAERRQRILGGGAGIFAPPAAAR